MHVQEMGTRTLEMVAVALSEEYGIKVVCNGLRTQTTYAPGTNKPIITIPSVDLYDEYYLILLRGYIDHEVGHVRFTDQPCIDAALGREVEIIGALKSIAYIYEDVYVERMMGEAFPGCKRNLRKLVSLVFNKRRTEPVPAALLLEEIREKKMKPYDLTYHIWAAISQYILYRVRQESLRELQNLLAVYREPVDLLAPGLADALEPVLARVPHEGTSSAANVALARETMYLVNDFFQNEWRWPDPKEIRIPTNVMSQLGWVLRSGGSSADKVDISKSTAGMVDSMLQMVDEAALLRNIAIHHGYGSTLWKERLLMLDDNEQIESLQASAMMDAQMQSLMQTFILNRSGPVRTGRLNTNLLYKLSTCDTGIFYKNIEKRGLDTEIVIAVDMSGSMRFDDKFIRASKALYAVVHSLKKIRGLVVNVMGFFDNNVMDILRSSDRITPRIKITPDGGTLCGVALKYAVQMFSNSYRSRKIVMMITDGDANDPDEFKEAIVRAKGAGIQFLGIGILDDHINRYLEEQECCVIDDVRQLAEEMFRMLSVKLRETA